LAAGGAARGAGRAAVGRADRGHVLSVARGQGRQARTGRAHEFADADGPAGRTARRGTGIPLADARRREGDRGGDRGEPAGRAGADAGGRADRETFVGRWPESTGWGCPCGAEEATTP